MKNSIFTVLAALVLYPAGAQPVTPQDRRRAAELVERMTLDEKIGQLVQQRGLQFFPASAKDICAVQIRCNFRIFLYRRSDITNIMELNYSINL